MPTRTTQPKRRAQLLREYHDPLSFMSNHTIRRLRIRYVVIALLCIAAGCVLWIALVLDRTPHVHSNGLQQLGGGFGFIALVILLTPYGVFRLFTIKRSIIAYRRRQLARDDTPNTKAKN